MPSSIWSAPCAAGLTVRTWQPAPQGPSPPPPLSVGQGRLWARPEGAFKRPNLAARAEGGVLAD
eukprot:SAG11_NODE_7172_length_1184_cov_0.799078_1_plen_63_part_10